MPTYDYSCEDCGTFEVVRPMSDRDAPCLCPYCDKEAQRKLLAAPSISTLAGEVRQAHAINERSADSPKRLSTHGPGRVGAGIGRARKTASDKSNSYPTSRPWMISR
ncbi:MAG: zinc ribbon domain-containing protein [Verrucomicrobiota bacterium]